jgi:hypothetical protein
MRPSLSGPCQSDLAPPVAQGEYGSATQGATEGYLTCAVLHVLQDLVDLLATDSAE